MSRRKFVQFSFQCDQCDYVDSVDCNCWLGHSASVVGAEEDMRLSGWKIGKQDTCPDCVERKKQTVIG